MAFFRQYPILKLLLAPLIPPPHAGMDSERHDYNDRIAGFRKHEYPMLGDKTYLDHAGTTLYSRTLIDAFSAEMLASLVGNPHSASNSARGTAHRIDNIRSRVLDFFRADPDHFDVVFVANATAAIKLVADAFRGHDGGFWFGYHRDSHTSVVGVRELATRGSRCFKSDVDADHWLNNPADDDMASGPVLFAYPGQSNMNGRRLPLHWSGCLRRSARQNAYSLLDVAALASTAPVDLSDVENAPDFVSLSFYKIFGFPDLGALIVRKDAAHVFDHRRYFGGGTVEMISCVDEQWHKMKQTSLHARLEDGTLPMRSILALGCAFEAHWKLFGRMEDVSKHTSWLAKCLYDRMKKLKHSNGTPVCKIYKDASSTYGDAKTQGATVTFNFCDSNGNWFSNHELNKLASVNNFHIRTGTLCNPGGMADSLGIRSGDLKRYHAAGFRCGSENDVRDGKAVGMARVSFGASSTMDDVNRWMSFVEEHLVEKRPLISRLAQSDTTTSDDYYIESLTIYPIKSCGGWSIPAGQGWPIKPQGLAWDREWGLVHRGTREYLSQKKCPRMALMRPTLDFEANLLHVHYTGASHPDVPSDIFIPLLFDESRFKVSRQECASDTCGDRTQLRIYASHDITNFFSSHLGTPCHLACLPLTPSTSRQVNKPFAKEPDTAAPKPISGIGLISPVQAPTPPPTPPPHPQTLSNDSPILTISRASVNDLNISANKPQHPSEQYGSIDPDRFRANILLAPRSATHATPYAEETWSAMRITRPPRTRAYFFSQPVPGSTDTTELRVLGRCRRCQMVCIDQQTGKTCSEPLSTLYKTRKWAGGVWFGVHCSLANSSGLNWGANTIRVGDWVEGVIQEKDPGPTPAV